MSLTLAMTNNLAVRPFHQRAAGPQCHHLTDWQEHKNTPCLAHSTGRQHHLHQQQACDDRGHYHTMHQNVLSIAAGRICFFDSPPLQATSMNKLAAAAADSTKNIGYCTLKPLHPLKPTRCYMQSQLQLMTPSRLLHHSYCKLRGGVPPSEMAKNSIYR